MNEFEDILRRLAEQVEQPLEPIETPIVTGEGRSADERVTVVMTGAEVASVDIDPRSMRKSTPELCADLKEAMNAAIAAHNTALYEAMQGTLPNPGEIRAGLEGVREEATRSLDAYLDTMTRMLEQNAAAQGGRP